MEEALAWRQKIEGQSASQDTGRAEIAAMLSAASTQAGDGQSGWQCETSARRETTGNEARTSVLATSNTPT